MTVSNSSFETWSIINHKDVCSISQTESMTHNYQSITDEYHYVKMKCFHSEYTHKGSDSIPAVAKEKNFPVWEYSVGWYSVALHLNILYIYIDFVSIKCIHCIFHHTAKEYETPKIASLPSVGNFNTNAVLEIEYFKIIVWLQKTQLINFISNLV